MIVFQLLETHINIILCILCVSIISQGSPDNEINIETIQMIAQPSQPSRNEIKANIITPESIFNAAIMDRIVGGIPCQSSERGFQVYLKIIGRFICGGSILSPNYVLTPAHCVDSFKEYTTCLRIVAGLNIRNESSEENAQVVEIEKIFVHPEYEVSRHTVKNDIAILQLKFPLKFTCSGEDCVRPVRLPTWVLDATTMPPAKGLLSGWGKIGNDESTSKALLCLKTLFVNVTDCKEKYTNVTTILDSMVCAGQEDEGGCKGDSGGPLTLSGLGKNNIQVGIISFGVICGHPDFPTVFTRVFHYVQWIKKVCKDCVYN